MLSRVESARRHKISVLFLWQRHKISVKTRHKISVDNSGNSQAFVDNSISKHPKEDAYFTRSLVFGTGGGEARNINPS